MQRIQGQCAKARSSEQPARWGQAAVICFASAALLPHTFGCSLNGEGTGRGRRDDRPVDGVDSVDDDAGDDGPVTGVTRPPSWTGDASITFPVDAVRPFDAGMPPVTERDAAVPPMDAARDAQIADEPDAQQLVDAGLPGDAGQSASDAATQTDAQVPEVCTTDGTYAVQLDFDVTWPETLYGSTTPMFAAGAGTFSLLTRLTVSSADGTSQAVLAPCGTNMPEIAGSPRTLPGERYGLTAANGIWDSAAMPRWSAISYGTCARPGCAFTLDPLFALLGASVTGVDELGTPVGVLVDHDADGLQAITFQSRTPLELSSTGKPYSYMPVGAVGRARKQLLGFLMVAELKGVFSSCGALSGAIEQAYLEQHAVGCSGVVTGTAAEVLCDEPSSQVLASTYPVWTVSSARFHGTRISTPTCTAVRAALR